MAAKTLCIRYHLCLPSRQHGSEPVLIVKSPSPASVSSRLSVYAVGVGGREMLKLCIKLLLDKSCSPAAVERTKSTQLRPDGHQDVGRTENFWSKVFPPKLRRSYWVLLVLVLVLGPGPQRREDISVVVVFAYVSEINLCLFA